MANGYHENEISVMAALAINMAKMAKSMAAVSWRKMSAYQM
jgi:hypothetical protein